MLNQEASQLGISVTELAQRLNISKSSANKLTHSSGFYPAFKIGKRIVISVSALERWIDEQTQQN